MGLWTWFFAKVPQKQDSPQDSELDQEPELDPPPPYTLWPSQPSPQQSPQEPPQQPSQKPLQELSQLPPQPPLRLISRRPCWRARTPPMLPPPTILGASSAWPIPAVCPFRGQTSCWTLMEYFVPEGFTGPLELESPVYLANLCLFAKDLPGLMKHGFHWGMANVVPEMGFVDSKRSGATWEDTKLTSLSLDHARYWFLQDLGGDPQWVAGVSINAKNFSALANFNLKKQLSPRNILAAAARSPDKLWVYSYNRHFPEHDFNAVHHDALPMEGCWPPQRHTQVD